MNHIAINNIKLCHDFDTRDSQLRHFWSLEPIGITDTDTAPHTIKDTAMLSSLSDSFRIEDGRAVESLPKKELVTPADNHTNGQRRFQTLTKRFATSTDFRIRDKSQCRRTRRCGKIQRQCLFPRPSNDSTETDVFL